MGFLGEELSESLFINNLKKIVSFYEFFLLVFFAFTLFVFLFGINRSVFVFIYSVFLFVGIAVSGGSSKDLLDHRIKRQG